MFNDISLEILELEYLGLTDEDIIGYIYFFYGDSISHDEL